MTIVSNILCKYKLQTLVKILRLSLLKKYLKSGQKFHLSIEFNRNVF